MRLFDLGALDAAPVDGAVLVMRLGSSENRFVVRGGGGMTILKPIRTDALQSAPAHALEPAHVHDDRPSIPTSRKIAPFMS